MYHLVIFCHHYHHGYRCSHHYHHWYFVCHTRNMSFLTSEKEVIGAMPGKKKKTFFCGRCSLISHINIWNALYVVTLSWNFNIAFVVWVVLSCNLKRLCCDKNLVSKQRNGFQPFSFFFCSLLLQEVQIVKLSEILIAR